MSDGQQWPNYKGPCRPNDSEPNDWQLKLVAKVRKKLFLLSASTP